MTYDEFVNCLEQARVSIRCFSSLVKTHANTFTNYSKNGRIPDHWAIIATLIVEMSKQGIDYKTLLSALDLNEKKVRGAAAQGKFGGDRQTDLFLGPKVRGRNNEQS